MINCHAIPIIGYFFCFRLCSSSSLVRSISMANHAPPNPAWKSDIFFDKPHSFLPQMPLLPQPFPFIRAWDQQLGVLLIPSGCEQPRVQCPSDMWHVDRGRPPLHPELTWRARWFVTRESYMESLGKGRKFKTILGQVIGWTIYVSPSITRDCLK